MRVEVLMQDGNGAALSAAVVSDTGAAVITRYFNGQWNPIYGINAVGERMQLPSCFRLNGESIDALNELHHGAPPTYMDRMQPVFDVMSGSFIADADDSL